MGRDAPAERPQNYDFLRAFSTPAVTWDDDVFCRTNRSHNGGIELSKSEPTSATRAFQRPLSDLVRSGCWTWRLVAIIVGLAAAAISNMDTLHRILRRLKITMETSYPSEWYSAFSRHDDCYGRITPEWRTPSVRMASRVAKPSGRGPFPNRRGRMVG